MRLWTIVTLILRLVACYVMVIGMITIIDNHITKTYCAKSEKQLVGTHSSYSLNNRGTGKVGVGVVLSGGGGAVGKMEGMLRN